MKQEKKLNWLIESESINNYLKYAFMDESIHSKDKIGLDGFKSCFNHQRSF